MKSVSVLPPILLWIRRDLRLSDHPALSAAVVSGRPIIPVFIRDSGVVALGAAPKWRLGLGLEDRGVVSTVEEFYTKSKASNLSDAALGWFFTASFDSSFMEKQASNLELNKKDTLFKNYISRELIEDYSSTLNPRQTIDSLINEVDIAKKFNKLKQLTTSNNINLISDSFTGVLGCDFLYAQEQTFTTPGLNIVIIGAGVCGLFLASSIKFALGFRVNVLLLDNRSKQKNTIRERKGRRIKS